ncbi:MAG TPA: trypsin-like peptidase domain-containing protein, partial [Fimbriimonadaceae bacterium]|nr:trypsin-like peptidase domain-containing protein [Fimbriimonadaceae bacterium]
MNIVPTNKQLLRTIFITSGVCAALIGIALLTLTSPTWAVVTASAAVILAVNIGITVKTGSRRWHRTFYLTSYQWVRRQQVLLTMAALSLALTGFTLEIDSRWAENQTSKNRPCSIADVEKASESVVLIEGKAGAGSGFWISPTIIATNNHVVDHNPDLVVDRTHRANIVATDSLRDIALITVIDVAPQPTTLEGVDSTPRLADDLYVIGHPLGRNLSITKGIVSAVTKDDYDDRQYIQTDAPISQGNSGGPVVDHCGHVVGMTTETLRGAENVGYAITWSQLSSRIAQMTKAAESSSPEERELTYPSDQAEVVAKYYSTLGGGDLSGAYNFYSAARKARLPYDSWSKGLGKTVFIRLISVNAGDRPNSVQVHFYSTEESETDTWQWQT